MRLSYGGASSTSCISQVSPGPGSAFFTVGRLAQFAPVDYGTLQARLISGPALNHLGPVLPRGSFESFFGRPERTGNDARSPSTRPHRKGSLFSPASAVRRHLPIARSAKRTSGRGRQHSNDLY
jgi:hypothetical protein